MTGRVACAEDAIDAGARKIALRRNESLLAVTGATADVGGWEFDLANGALWWSDHTCRIHGLEQGARLTLARAIDFYAPEARSRIRAAVERAINDSQGFDLELPLVREDETRIWVRATGRAEFEKDKPVRLLGALQDITRQVEQRQSLADQCELLRVTLQSIGDAVIAADAASRVIWLNSTAEHMTGRNVADAAGRPLSEIFHLVDDHTRRTSVDPAAECLREGVKVSLSGHETLISRTGEEFGVGGSAAPVRNAAGEVLGAVVVFHDVSGQRRLSGEMNYRATHDALTGLLNRMELESRLGKVLIRSSEDDGVHALVCIDLDQFKLVNDACGHAAGDELLRQVGGLIRGVISSNGTLARIGGDEFAVILEDCPDDRAERVAQRICERMDDFRFVHDGRRFRIGTSIGLVSIDGRWSSTSELMQAAAAACHAAKEAGRNRVHVWFDADQNQRERDRETRWAERLEQAIDDDRLVLHAQRIEAVSQGTRELHAEVLLRLRDDDGEVVLPSAFLPAAERFYLMTRIDRWVLRRSIEYLEACAELDAVGSLSVNVSGQSIGDRAFHRDAIAALERAGGEICRRLRLEITETVAVTNVADAIHFAERVRALGVGIALDDFGSGASSFGYLKTLPVDVLKIDGQYISTMIDDDLADAAVRCFVDVARLTGVKTVAECVDRPEVLERVRAIGIDYAQGFMLHEPEPIENVFEARGEAVA